MPSVLEIQLGEQVRIKIAHVLRSGKVLDIHDIIEMTTKIGLSRGTASVIVKTCESGDFANLTGLRPKRIMLSPRHVLIYDDSFRTRDANLRKKLQSMFVDSNGKPVKEWLRQKIENAMSKHDLKKK